MKSYKTKIEVCVLILMPLLAVSCGGSGTQGGSNNTDPVVSSKPTVALTAEQVNAVVGDTFTVDIATSNFPTSEGGGVTVQFDAATLNVSDVSINAGSWNFVNKVGSIDNNTGVISDILFSSFKGVTGDSQIATITFNAIASGDSQIVLGNSPINPFSSDGGVIAVSFIHSNVQIAPAQ